MTTAKSALDQFKSSINKALTTRPNIPEGHTPARAMARVFGPDMHATPTGHAVELQTPIFDNTVTTALDAIMAAAKKRHGIEPHAANWLLELAEDVVHPSNIQPYPFSKLYYFRYLPEQAIWKDKKLTTAGVGRHQYKDQHWLTKKWKRAGDAVDQSLATSLVPSTLAQTSDPATTATSSSSSTAVSNSSTSVSTSAPTAAGNSASAPASSTKSGSPSTTAGGK